MKITTLVLIGILYCFGCNPVETGTSIGAIQESDPKVSVLNSVNSNKLGLTELRYISIIHNSISNQERSKLEILILDSVLIHDYFSKELGTYPDSDYENKLLDIYRISDQEFLVISEYHSPFGPFGLCGQVAVVDINRYIVVNKTMIEGGKYHAPEINWMDIDQDGEKEIVSRLVYSTSSIPVLDVLETVFELKGNTFDVVEVLNTTTEAINCVSPIDGIELIQRNYSFETPLRVKTIERFYSFNCDEDWEGIETSKKLSDRQVFFLKRSSENGFFEIE